MSFTSTELEVIARASNDFTYFVNEIFSKSTKAFIGGEYVDDTCRFLSKSKRTIRVSARNHFKSYAFYAHFMWKLMFEGLENYEVQYFSFNSDLAAYHISKIKDCIRANPYFRECRDLKTNAESVIKYTWDNKHFVSLDGHGLIQFKRGIHCDVVNVDDPFQDPQSDLNLNIIHKVNEVFKSNILDMPKEPYGELHVCGTLQTSEDFFFDPAITKRFSVRITPAITAEGKALWPEWMNLTELEEKRKERTDRVFQKEYLCTPVYSTKAFFTREKLNTNVVNSNLSNWQINKEYHPLGDVIAGYDIGKKSHPSHFVVFEERDGRFVMVHQIFMDGWNYANGKEYDPSNPTQLEYIKQAIKNFKIRVIHFDATRGEFESFMEQGILPRQMEPVIFTTKSRVNMSTVLDRLVEQKRIELINDDRYLNQICSVTNDLQAITSIQGHGDSFWSTGLAFLGNPELMAYEENITPRMRKKITTGQPSIFNNEVKVPTGW
ncbi:MAG: hypothetical protein WC755_08905 [Candidatus Woesearchaeota archaeon]|jgi:hypothetical protein